MAKTRQRFLQAKAWMRRRHCTIEKKDSSKRRDATPPAMVLAATDDDIASLAKNHAMSSWKLFKTLRDLEEPDSTYHPHIEKALKNFQKALQHGEGMKPDAWLHQLKESYFDCLRDFTQSIESLDPGEQAAAIKWLEQALKIDADRSFFSRSYKDGFYRQSTAPPLGKKATMMRVRI